MTVNIENILENAVIVPSASNESFQKEFTATFTHGSLLLRQWQLDEMEVNYSELELKEPVSISWTSRKDTCSLLFVLAGEIEVNGCKAGSMQHAVVNCAGPLNYSQLHNRILEIYVSRKLPSQLLPGYEQHSSTPAYIDIRMFAAIGSIINCRLQGNIKKLFLQGKCLELLALQAASFERQSERKYVYCKTEYDRERILFAREYLLQNYDLPPTLPELARMAGINEFKLKKGFKELFGDTVFGYLHNYKMDLAEKELSQGDKTASQLAYDLGYSSLQHFSNVFKRHFGYPPSHFKGDNRY